MKPQICFPIHAALFALLLPLTTHAQSSATSISFQGALTGAGGAPLANGSYSLTFRFYSNAVGGVAIGETNATGVAVDGGVASTAIPVQPSWFNGQTRYLGLSVGNGSELFPRVLVTAVPYAVTAQNLSFGEIMVSGEGNVGIGTTNPLRAIHVRRSDSFAGLALDGHDNGADSTRNVTGLMFYRDSVERGGVFWNNDDTLRIFAQTGNRFDGIIVNGAGRVGIGSVSATARFNVEGTASMTVCQITSDRHAKTGFKPADNRAVLNKLVSLPITTWAYTNTPNIRHLGPVAQDFAAAFALGEDDKHIATVDADGVALAAIQGLHQLMQERDSEIACLKAEVNAILARLEYLFRQLPTTPTEAAPYGITSALKFTPTASPE